MVVMRLLNALMCGPFRARNEKLAVATRHFCGDSPLSSFSYVRIGRRGRRHARDA